MPAAADAAAADVLLVESTYGNRAHPPRTTRRRSWRRSSATPCSAAARCCCRPLRSGRAQALLLVLQRLKARRRDPAPTCRSSWTARWRSRPPRCTAATAGCCACRRARSTTCATACAWSAPRSSRCGWRSSRYPAVIISASGMATGGRVLHHLKAMAPDPAHHIVFAGFQVGGSRGARLVAGDREVKIHGEYVPVRAAVSHLEGFSGHADADELLDWLRRMRARAAPDLRGARRARRQRRAAPAHPGRAGLAGARAGTARSRLSRRAAAAPRGDHATSRHRPSDRSRPFRTNTPSRSHLVATHFSPASHRRAAVQRARDRVRAVVAEEHRVALAPARPPAPHRGRSVPPPCAGALQVHHQRGHALAAALAGPRACRAARGRSSRGAAGTARPAGSAGSAGLRRCPPASSPARRCALDALRSAAPRRARRTCRRWCARR